MVCSPLPSGTTRQPWWCTFWWQAQHNNIMLSMFVGPPCDTGLM